MNFYFFLIFNQLYTSYVCMLYVYIIICLHASFDTLWLGGCSAAWWLAAFILTLIAVVTHVQGDGEALTNPGVTLHANNVQIW